MQQDVAYLWLIDGVGPAFVSREDLDDAYVQALGFTRAHPGLVRPSNLTLALDPRVGLAVGSSATLELEDVDGTLATVFGADLDDTDELLVKIDAADDPAPSAVWGRHVGHEFIGPAGERRRRSCVPGFEVGLAHRSAIQAQSQGVSATPVSDTPVLWPGRRCALYRLVREATGDWPDLTVEANRIAARCWYGTLLGQGTQDAHHWSFRCAGEESWQMGTLGEGLAQDPLPLEVALTIDDDLGENVLVGWLDVVDLFDEDNDLETYTYVDDTLDTGYLSGATSYDDVATGFNSFIKELADDNTLGPAYSSQGFSALAYRTSPGDDGVQVRWDRDAAFNAISDRYTVRLRVLAHVKAWKVLGFDPAVQNSSIDAASTPEKYGQFERPTGEQDGDEALADYALQYPQHWLGTFYAADAVAMLARDQGKTYALRVHTDNAGGYRRWPPIYAGGTSVFDFEKVSQSFRVRTYDPMFLSSSTAVPLPADPDDASAPLAIPDVGKATHQGLVAITGPYRDETDPAAEVLVITLVARVAWREVADGSVALDSSGRPKLVIYAWPEPRLYGFTDRRPQLWAAWRTPPEGGQAHEMRSLIVLEHGPGPDTVASIWAQLAASTGTAGGWYTDATLATPAFGLDGDAALDVGANDLGLVGVGDEALGRHTDAQTAELGLGIPAEMIAATAAERGGVELALQRQLAEDLYRCKIVVATPVSVRAIVQELLAPSGWAVSFAGGKIGLFDPFTFAAPVSDTGVITVESLRGEPGEPGAARPSQSLRKWAPIDRVEIKARRNPIEGSYVHERTIRSPDPGAIYRRHQSQLQSIDGAHLIDPTVVGLDGADWRTSWIARWRKACRWWARQHFEVQLDLPARRHLETGPGSLVTVTSPWLVSPVGAVYGVVQAPGWIVSRSLDAAGELIRVTAIVDATAVILYAPSARVTRYDEDDEAEGFRLFVEDDYLSIRANTQTLDVDGFAEPAWSSAGGDATVEVLGWTGSAWVGGTYGEIQSINAVPSSSYIKLTGALTGLSLRDERHMVILREAATQPAAWPTVVYAPTGDEDGIYDGASAKAPRFKDD